MKAEKEEIAEEPFVIRPYLKSELAHLYNPYVPLVYAMRKMREWIRNIDTYTPASTLRFHNFHPP